MYIGDKKIKKYVYLFVCSWVSIYRHNNRGNKII